MLGGSAALGAYEPGRSDVDVIAVVAEPVAPEALRTLAGRVSQAELPCPARQLELVVWRRGSGRPFELNLNTGVERADHVGVDPEAEPTFWFAIDRAIARERGRSLLGPPPGELLDEPPRAELLTALRESLDWHAKHEPDGPDAILNAARAWRWARTGRWTSKRRAAEWAIGRMSDPSAVAAALAARDAGERMDPDTVAGALAAMRTAIDAAA